MKTGILKFALLAVVLWPPALMAGPAETHGLGKDFQNPPASARPWVYWWWLNGAASREGITRDFEDMRRQGLGGALLFDAGAAGPEAPRGPAFMSPAWRELFRHAVREADRCGIVLSVNLCSGWNAGGPWVTRELAARKLVLYRRVVEGPGRVVVQPPEPWAGPGDYRPIAVLAAPCSDGSPAEAVLLPREPAAAGSPAAPLLWKRAGGVDVTKLADAQGRLDWNVPAGRWQVAWLGSVLHGHKTKCPGGGPAGWEIDPMNAGAMEAHFAETGAKLIADAGPLAGRTLQYVHIDSWELGQPTWTPRMREEFQKRRGYDPLPWLPAVAGMTVDSIPETERFMQDYRRTVADLVAANYYGRLRELALQGGLRGAHPESGGPFFTQWIDALECEAINDVPMGEFWKRKHEPDGTTGWPHNPSLKQAASVAHVYGRPLCQAEAFTMSGDDWNDDPWSMKDIGDAAFCEGLTRNVLCFWVHQPQPGAKPGFQWAHIGAHLDNQVTWWPMAGPWLAYLARCQYLLRQGLFVADFLYLQDERIPSFIPKRPEQKPQRPDGCDYDVISAAALRARVSVVEGRLALPDGMSYRYLVLPHQPGALLSPATLEKVRALAGAGAAVIAPPALAGSLPKARQGPLADIAAADGLPPDIAFLDPSPGAAFDWIHRRAGGIEIYFISNQSAREASVDVAFRVTGKQPELWDAVTGNIRKLPGFREREGGTRVPMQFAPRQSGFVVFREPPRAGGPGGGANFPAPAVVRELEGPWTVDFDPAWGGPERVRFDTLQDWTERPEEGIRHYSGTAVYRQEVKLAESEWEALREGAFLNLGMVKNLARVRLNGRDLGVVWTAPWQVDVAGALREGTNQLEIEVANLWPNRLIGDAPLPREKRFTTTNVPTYETVLPPNNGWIFSTWNCPRCDERRKTGRPAQLLPSGLLGPVRLLAVEWRGLPAPAQR